MNANKLRVVGIGGVWAIGAVLVGTQVGGELGGLAGALVGFSLGLFLGVRVWNR